MWRCERCGREFAKKNQSHSCGISVENVEMYIAAQPEAIQPILIQVRAAIKEILPDVEERISWQMPTYWKNQNIIHFAAHKNHFGLHVGARAIEAFSESLEAYKTSKGAIQFPYNAPIPIPLIQAIAKWCYETVNPH